MSLTITKVTCPSSKVAIKCPYSMSPIGITIHNTANDASAMAEVSYMLGNNNYVSYHYAVDDTRAVQGIDLNRNAFHASDGATGTGNRKTIAIEICYSKSGGTRFTKSEQNAAKLVAKLCKQYGWTTKNVKRHYDYAVDKKRCPHRTMDLGWDRFLKMCDNELAALKGTTTTAAKSTTTSTATTTKSTTTTKYKVGSKVTATVLSTNSAGTGKIYKGKWTGTITKVISGAKYPYLLNSNTGWINDAGISGSTTTSTTKSTTTSTTIKKGSTVKVTKAVSYDGVKLSVSGNYTVMELKGNRAVIGRGGVVTAAINVANLKLV